MKDKIDSALQKAAEFLAKKQKKEGNWEKDKTIHNEPADYMTDLVLTSESIGMFTFIKNTDYLENMRKAAFFCAEYELEPNALPVLWAWKLLALKNLNTPYNVNLKKQAEEILIKTQKDGYWPVFPTTSNLNNFYAIFALFNTGNEKVLNKTKKWLEASMAKDGKGWGMDHNAEVSEVTFTANAIISLILSGASPDSKHLTDAKKFIESSQKKSGAWISTKFTTPTETTYATSFGTLSLMLLSNNPFDEQVQKGISYLLKSQRTDGSWPLVANEKQGLIYTTYFAVLAIAFYKYLLDNLDAADELLAPPVSTCLLFKQFLKESNKALAWMTISKMFDSKILGSTINAIDRRKDIISVLLNNGAKDVAAVIDELKKQEKYNYLNKKHHITQIKSDMEYLKDIKIVDKIYDLYFICTDFFKL